MIRLRTPGRQYPSDDCRFPRYVKVETESIIRYFDNLAVAYFYGGTLYRSTANIFCLMSAPARNFRFTVFVCVFLSTRVVDQRVSGVDDNRNCIDWNSNDCCSDWSQLRQVEILALLQLQIQPLQRRQRTSHVTAAGLADLIDDKP